MSELETFTVDAFASDTTDADVARLAGAWQQLSKIAGEEYERIRDRALRPRLVEQAKVGGLDGITQRVGDLGTVVLTAPTRSVRILDPEALAGWLADVGADDLHDVRPVVDVVDHRGAAAVLADVDDLTLHGDDEELHAALVDLATNMLRASTVTVLADNAVDIAAFRRLCKITETRVVDLASGEPVPGVTVEPGRQQVRVTVDPARKAALRGRLRAALTDGGPDHG